MQSDEAFPFAGLEHTQGALSHLPTNPAGTFRGCSWQTFATPVRGSPVAAGSSAEAAVCSEACAVIGRIVRHSRSERSLPRTPAGHSPRHDRTSIRVRDARLLVAAPACILPLPLIFAQKETRMSESTSLIVTSGRVATRVLIGTVPLILVKMPANPVGLPVEVFGGVRRQLAANRAVPFRAATSLCTSSILA